MTDTQVCVLWLHIISSKFLKAAYTGRSTINVWVIGVSAIPCLNNIKMTPDVDCQRDRGSRHLRIDLSILRNSLRIRENQKRYFTLSFY
jgi:hypothetical protein